MNTTFLKLAVSALGLAAVTFTPALAKSSHQAHARAPAAVDQSVPPDFARGGAAVLDNGRIVGTDPDPSVRFELERDRPTYLGDN